MKTITMIKKSGKLTFLKVLTITIFCLGSSCSLNPVSTGQIWVTEPHTNPFIKIRIDTFYVIDVKNDYILYMVNSDSTENSNHYSLFTHNKNLYSKNSASTPSEHP